MPLKPVKPGSKVQLTDDNATDDREPKGEEAEQLVAPIIEKIVGQQVALYAEAKQALAVAWREVKVLRPEATRRVSTEVFLVATGKR